jgi:hypothetical protein
MYRNEPPFVSKWLLTTCRVAPKTPKAVPLKSKLASWIPHSKLASSRMPKRELLKMAAAAVSQLLPQ